LHSSEKIKAEAEAFDQRIEERIKAGFVPDIRRAVKCDHFYKSFFRDPYFIKLYLGNEINHFLHLLKKYSNSGSKVLEVGCGPGYVSLEIARNGYHVTGFDISHKAIEVAKKTQESNPYKDGFGSLEFKVSSFKEFTGIFDVVLIRGAIHHMNDPEGVILKILNLLEPGGLLLCLEPSHEKWRKQDAAQVALIRGLLSLTGNWYESSLGKELLDPKKFEEVVDDILIEYVNERDKYEMGGQSPNDNSSSGKEILEALRKHFLELEYTPGISFIYRILGGLRGEDDLVHKIASMLTIYDKLCIDKGFMEPNNFFFAGRKK